jgi:hypothetical protein
VEKPIPPIRPECWRPARVNWSVTIRVVGGFLVAGLILIPAILMRLLRG